MVKQCNECTHQAVATCKCSPQTFFCQSHWREHKQNTSTEHCKEFLTTGIDPAYAKEVRNHAKELLKRLKVSKLELIAHVHRLIAEIEHSARYTLRKLDEVSTEITHLIELAKTNQAPVHKFRNLVDSAVLEQREWVLSFELLKPLADTIEVACLDIRRDSEETKTPDPQASNSERISSPPDIRRHVNGSTLACSRGHPLVWNNLAPFRAFEATNSYWIQCTVCSQSFSNSSWHCQPCGEFVCKKCGEMLNFTPPELMCKNHHTLQWRGDTSAYYRERGTWTFVRCDCCKINIPAAGNWHCRECKFDICQACGAKRGYNPSLYTMCDPTGRPFTAKKVLLGICFKCRRPSKRLYKASKKLKNICAECVSSFVVAGPAHPIVSCSQQHLLQWTGQSAFSCNKCGASYSSARYSCSQCQYDLCFSCVDQLVQSILT